VAIQKIKRKKSIADCVEGRPGRRSLGRNVRAEGEVVIGGEGGEVPTELEVDGVPPYGNGRGSGDKRRMQGRERESKRYQRAGWNDLTRKV